MSNLCPCCGQPYSAAADLPAPEAGWDGKLAQPAFKARKSGSRRYLIPADLRQLAGIWSSRNAAIRRVGREVLVWRL
jgi:hypothetical protein